VRKPASILLVAVLATSIGTVYFLRSGLDCRRYSDDIVEELAYFPSGRLIKVVDLGFSSLVADAMWLRGIQYYGEHRKADRHYPLAEHVFMTIANLDPGFVDSYRFGALVLSQDVGTPAVAISLLKKGLRANPDTWQIPFDLGFIYYVTLNDYDKAAHYFRIASRAEGAPEIARRFSAFAYRKAGKNDVARSLWEQIYISSSNKITKDIAQHSLLGIRLDDEIEQLGRAVDAFRADRGRAPTPLSELVAAGLVRCLPDDPFGGSYFIDPETETVTSTTRASEEAGKAIGSLRKQVERYRASTGAYPHSLEQLKQQGLIAEIPRVAGARVTYDPATGCVAYDLVWKETGQ
jgi:tetratricopeptide (TPR) repeat protein